MEMSGILRTAPIRSPRSWHPMWRSGGGTGCLPGRHQQRSRRSVERPHSSRDIICAPVHARKRGSRGEWGNGMGATLHSFEADHLFSLEYMITTCPLPACGLLSLLPFCAFLACKGHYCLIATSRLQQPWRWATSTSSRQWPSLAVDCSVSLAAGSITDDES